MAVTARFAGGINLIRCVRAAYSRRDGTGLAMHSRDDSDDETLCWHSVNSDKYRKHPECPHGERVKPTNVRQGTGGKQLCQTCDERIDSVYLRVRG